MRRVLLLVLVAALQFPTGVTAAAFAPAYGGHNVSGKPARNFGCDVVIVITDASVRLGFGVRASLTTKLSARRHVKLDRGCAARTTPQSYAVLSTALADDYVYAVFASRDRPADQVRMIGHVEAGVLSATYSFCRTDGRGWCTPPIKLDLSSALV